MIVDADTLVGFWPIRNADISLAKLKDLMKRHKVERACVCSARGVWYDYEEGNDETVEITKGNPQLTPVMTLDPRRFIGCREEVRRRTSEGFRLFRLFPEHQGWSASTTSARKLLSFLEEAGAIVMLGGPAAEAVPVVRGLQVPVILTWSHFYQLGELLAGADELPNVYLTTRFLIAPGSLDVAVATLGANRLVFGSNAPVAYMASALRLIDSAHLTGPQRTAILGGNLLQLLGGSDDHN